MGRRAKPTPRRRSPVGAPARLPALTELYPTVQPTAAALRSRDSSLTDEAPRALLRRMKG